MVTNISFYRFGGHFVGTDSTCGVVISCHVNNVLMAFTWAQVEQFDNVVPVEAIKALQDAQKAFNLTSI